MTDLNLFSFGMATPQSSGKPATTSTGSDSETGFAAMLAAQRAPGTTAAGEKLSEPAQFTDQQPDALHESFISRHVKSLIGKILTLGQGTNDSTEAQALPFTAGGETAFRVPPSGGSGGFSRTARLINEPFPPEGGTLNAPGQIPELDQMAVSAKPLDWNPFAAPLVMLPSAARRVSPAPEAAPGSVAQDEEPMNSAQMAHMPFAEFYTLPVTTPRSYESAPGTLAARAQSLFKALEHQPDESGTASASPENVRQAAQRFSLFMNDASAQQSVSAGLNVEAIANEPLAHTDFAGTRELEFVPQEAQPEPEALPPANVQPSLEIQSDNLRSTDSGIQVEYTELPTQELDAALVVASSPAESKESILREAMIASEETTLPGVRGPRFERDELRLRNLMVAQSAAASSVESKESFTSAAMLTEAEPEQGASIAPHRGSSAFLPGVSERTIGESPVRAVQPEDSFGPSPMASGNNENPEQISGSTEGGQTEVRPTFLAEKSAKPDPHGEANVDEAATDLPAPALNNAAVLKTGGAKVEEPNATVRQLTPPLIEASESLTPGKPHVLRLNLQPVDLGPVEIQITRDANGHLNAHLTVEREAAGQTLSEGIPQLREALERAGLQVDRLAVSINSGWNGEGQAKQADAQQFTRASGTDFFEADPANISGADAAQDRLLNLHA